MKKLLSISKLQRGFTLIELLIVIAIISILIAIGAVSYSTIQSRARDAQRKSDLLSIANALESSFSDYGFYPATSINHVRNTLFACHNTGHPTSIGDDSSYYYTALANIVDYAHTHRQFSCQDFYTGTINTYMEEIPFDPLNPMVCASCPPDDGYYYNYYSYNQNGILCYYDWSPQCTIVQSSSVDWKPTASKYKLVAIMENRNEATNASGDQDPAICRKVNFCYVVSSPNY